MDLLSQRETDLPNYRVARQWVYLIISWNNPTPQSNSVWNDFTLNIPLTGRGASMTNCINMKKKYKYVAATYWFFFFWGGGGVCTCVNFAQFALPTVSGGVYYTVGSERNLPVWIKQPLQEQTWEDKHAKGKVQSPSQAREMDSVRRCVSCMQFSGNWCCGVTFWWCHRLVTLEQQHPRGGGGGESPSSEDSDKR